MDGALRFRFIKITNFFLLIYYFILYTLIRKYLNIKYQTNKLLKIRQKSQTRDKR